MARILFTVLPLAGHLNPALSLAAELRGQGHEIAWAVQTEEIADELPGWDRIYALDAGTVRSASQPSAVRGLESVRMFFEDYALPLAEAALPKLEVAVREFRPDVIAADHEMVAGALIARRLRVPWVSLVTTTASIQMMSPAVQNWVEALYLALQQRCQPGTPSVDWPDFSPSCVLVFSVEGLVGKRGQRYPAPYRFVGPAGAGGRRSIAFSWDWLRADCRHLLITMGTVSRDLSPRFFEVMMEAVGGLPDVQAVMVAPETLAGSAPVNVLACSRVPQFELLERCQGVVCHAGHNTVCEALSFGLPMIVSPFRDDQPVIAQQIVDAGAALFLRHGKVTAAAARDAIRRLLDEPDLSANARRLEHELRAAPGIAGAAAAVMAVAGA